MASGQPVGNVALGWQVWQLQDANGRSHAQQFVRDHGRVRTARVVIVRQNDHLAPLEVRSQRGGPLVGAPCVAGGHQPGSGKRIGVLLTLHDEHQRVGMLQHLR
ncbi:hypothetical protein D9M69_469820 [compost metagenome]